MITDGDFHQIFGSIPIFKILEIDLSRLNTLRSQLPLLKDRRADLYKF